jgi:hypothetical protein
MTLLYPRISGKVAASLWEDRKNQDLTQLALLSKNSHPNQYFAAVGGQRVEPEKIDWIAGKIRGIATNFGYPQTGSRTSLANFDTETAIFLATELDIQAGEALRAETWSFLCLVALPDVVKWRFPGFPPSRCTGGRRDCFHRLWIRGKAFDLGDHSDNRWVLLNELTEDCFVSILERPSLGGNPEVCRVLGLSWMKTSTKIGKARMEEVNRGAIKRIRAKGTLIMIDALSYNELKALVDESYLVQLAAAD